MSQDDSLGATHRGRLLILAAAVLWSTSGLFVKGGPLADLPEAERGPILACYRALFAAGFLTSLIRRRSMRWRPMLVPMALSFTAMNVLFVTALTRTTAAAAIFLQYTSPVWALVFAWVLLSEEIDRRNLVAVVVAMCGIVAIVAGDWTSSYFAGNLMALGSGVCYAGVVVCLRYLRDQDSAWLVALNHAVGGLVVLPWVLSLGVRLTPLQWTLVAAFGVGQMALPYWLFARGVRSVTAQEAALMTLLEPLLNPLWVALVWHEAVPTTTWAGGALILAGLAWRYGRVRIPR